MDGTEQTQSNADGARGITLTEFLLARIEEDEHFGTHDRHLSKRWPAECEAKRQIVEGTPSFNASGGLDMWPWQLRALALPHADHRDYRQEWKL